MKLPNAEQASVHPDKILKYLLSDTHERGQSKAKFFKRFGFTLESWKALDMALRQHAAMTIVARTEDTIRGTKYMLEGPIICPDGRTPYIRTIWVIELDRVTPRFVSAYPLGEQ